MTCNNLGKETQTLKGPFTFTLIAPVLLLSVVATGFAEEELWTMTDEKVIYNTLLGQVGIGTDSPQATLHVADSSEPTIRLSDQNGEHALFVLAGSVGWGLPFVTAGDLVVKSQNGDVVLYGQTGAVRLATNGQEVLTVEDNFVDVGSNTVTANLRVFGTTTTDIIEIIGGSDLAERFDVSGSEEIEPGMVMCIDPDRPGMLRLARDAYDRTVAGVVSGAGGVNPGVVLGQEGTAADGELPIALSGRVFVMTETSNGPIRPGDLLTTSAVPGHAMRVDDHGRAQGAILGKAMTELNAEQGLVLTLVSLQ